MTIRRERKLVRVEHELTIAAPPSVVWQLTEDIESWPDLTPTMTRVERLDKEGPLKLGSRAKVKQPGQRATIWTVTRFQPDDVFAWEAKVFGVRMVATHVLVPVGDGCRNTLTIDISGPGARLVGRLAGKKIAAAIATENEGFKRRAEGLARQ